MADYKIIESSLQKINKPNISEEQKTVQSVMSKAPDAKESENEVKSDHEEKLDPKLEKAQEYDEEYGEEY